MKKIKSHLAKLVVISIALFSVPIFQSSFAEGLGNQSELINGHFSTGITFKGWPQNFKESQIDGWWTTSPDHLMEIWQANNGPKQDAKSAIDDSYFCEVNATHSAMLYQVFNVTPGEKLKLSFYHSARAKGQDVINVIIGNFFGATTEWTGDMLFAQNSKETDANYQPLFAARVGTDQSWHRYEGTFTVPENMTKLLIGFQSVSTASGNPSIGNFVDAVRISRTSGKEKMGTDQLSFFRIKSFNSSTSLKNPIFELDTNHPYQEPDFKGHAPTIESLETNHDILSSKENFNQFYMKSTVKDVDKDEKITVKYSIVGYPNYQDKNIVSFQSDGNLYTFETKEITITKTEENKQYIFKVWAEDEKGNKSEELEKTIMIFNTGPTISFLSKPPTVRDPASGVAVLSQTFSPEFTATSDIKVTSFEIELDNQPYENGTPISDSGEHIITMKATDEVGNVNETLHHFQINYPPNLSQSTITPELLLAHSKEIDLAPYFSDPENANLTYKLANEHPDIIDCQLEGSKLVLTTTHPDSLPITIVASDGINDSAPLTIDFRITEQKTLDIALPLSTTIKATTSSVYIDNYGLSPVSINRIAFAKVAENKIIDPKESFEKKTSFEVNGKDAMLLSLGKETSDWQIKSSFNGVEAEKFPLNFKSRKGKKTDSYIINWYLEVNSDKENRSNNGKVH